jgi:hypothetical protein
MSGGPHGPVDHDDVTGSLVRRNDYAIQSDGCAGSSPLPAVGYSPPRGGMIRRDDLPDADPYFLAF